jgi:hypothetical protein
VWVVLLVSDFLQVVPQDICCILDAFTLKDFEAPMNTAICRGFHHLNHDITNSDSC